MKKRFNNLLATLGYALFIFVIALIFGLLATALTPEKATGDTGCSVSGSVLCGKVVNYHRSSRNLVVIDERGYSKSLPPGYGSRSIGYYLQDVERYVVPAYHCAWEYVSGGKKTRFTGSHYIRNNVGNFVIWLRKAGTC